MNLVRRPKEFDSRKMIPLVCLLAAAMLCFAWLGILRPLGEKTRAYNDLSQLRDQLTQANERLLEFDAVQQDYIRYSPEMLTESEGILADRTEVLTLVAQDIAPWATVENFSINGNILTMNLSGITLEDAGALTARLEAATQVRQAVILSATADDGQQARILLSITLENASREVAAHD